MTAASLAHALSARKIGSTWMAKCPGHNDKSPSLSITERDGTLLVHCHAGCAQETVIAQLRDRGLWHIPEPKPASVPRERKKKTGTIVATYDYTDEDGKLLYQVVRYEPKNFSVRIPDGKGGWVHTKHPRSVLYRLPEVIEAPIVLLVEGEKDVETLRGWGFVGTTAPFGASAEWLDSYSEFLRGREVVIIPDRDTTGWKRAWKIAKRLLPYAGKLLVLDLPGEAKDITEWFEQGHSEVELIFHIETPAVKNA